MTLLYYDTTTLLWHYFTMASVYCGTVYCGTTLRWHYLTKVRSSTGRPSRLPGWPTNHGATRADRPIRAAAGRRAVQRSETRSETTTLARVAGKA